MRRLSLRVPTAFLSKEWMVDRDELTTNPRLTVYNYKLAEALKVQSATTAHCLVS